MPVVAVVACGAPLTRRIGDVVTELVAGGWQVRLIGTPSARAWFGPGQTSSVLGVTPQFDFRSPDQPRPAGDPDIVAVVPGTFNTINKVAGGIADNYATALICETLGMRSPLLVAPMVSNKLWNHPALSSSFALLSDVGVRFLDVQTGERGLSPIKSGSGELVVDKFRPSWLVAALQSMI
jgi:phosphopantothenoylcysteine synthetase/decarboxylase